MSNEWCHRSCHLSSRCSMSPSCVRAGRTTTDKTILLHLFFILWWSKYFRTKLILGLYFSGEKDALSFTVWGGDGFQLEEIQQYLDLQANEKENNGFGTSCLQLSEKKKASQMSKINMGGSSGWAVLLTCAITSRDQLSPMLMGCVGLTGILLSFSAGLSKVGPNTVAKLWRDILLTLSFSATLGKGRQTRPQAFVAGFCVNIKWCMANVALTFCG